jgi:hypothetical protein
VNKSVALIGSQDHQACTGALGQCYGLGVGTPLEVHKAHQFIRHRLVVGQILDIIGRIADGQGLQVQTVEEQLDGTDIRIETDALSLKSLHSLDLCDAVELLLELSWRHLVATSH